MANYDFVRTLVSIYSGTIITFSYILNVLVIYLAKNKSNKCMSEYSVIIILTAAVDILFNTMNLLVGVVVCSIDGKMFFLNMGLLGRLDQPYACWLSFLWLFTLMLTVVTVPVQFVYRYSRICRRVPWPESRIALMYAALVAWLTAHCVAGALVFEHRPQALQRFRKHLLHLDYFGATIPHYTVGDGADILSGLHMLHANTIVFVSYGIVIVMGYRITTTLRRTRHNMSPKTGAAQRQLSIIMLVQSLCPFFVMAVPITCAIVAVALHKSATELSLYLTDVTLTIPIVNSVVVVAVIPSFRRFFKGMVGKAVGKSVSETTNATKAAPSMISATKT